MLIYQLGPMLSDSFDVRMWWHVISKHSNLLGSMTGADVCKNLIRNLGND